MLMIFGPLNDGHPNKHRLEANVVGSGTAWISTNGRTIKGTWKKKSLTAPTQFFDAAGKPVTLTVGQTFVQVAAGRAGLRRPRSRTARSRRAASPSPSARRLEPDRPDPAGTGRRPRPRGGPARRPRRRRPASRGPRRPTSAARLRRAALRRGGQPPWTRVVGPDRAQSATARRSGSRGSTRSPAGPTISGQRPDRRRDDRRPAGDRLDGGQPGRLGQHGQDRRAGAADEPGERVGAASAGRVGQRTRRCPRGRRPGRATPGRPGSRRRSRTRGGHGDIARAGRPAGPPRRAPRAPRAASRGPAGRRTGREDEVALGQPEPLALGGGVVVGRGGRSAAATPVAGANAGRGASGTTRIRSRRRWSRRRAAVRRLRLPDDHRRRVAQQLRPAAAARTGRRRCAGRPPAAPTARGRAASTTTGSPDAIGQRPAADRVVDGPGRAAAARPARPPRAIAPRSRNGSTVIAAERSSRVGGSRRRPTTSRCAIAPRRVVEVATQQEARTIRRRRLGVVGAAAGRRGRWR